jgi:hypothetical protein
MSGCGPVIDAENRLTNAVHAVAADAIWLTDPQIAMFGPGFPDALARIRAAVAEPTQHAIEEAARALADVKWAPAGLPGNDPEVLHMAGSLLRLAAAVKALDVARLVGWESRDETP